MTEAQWLLGLAANEMRVRAADISDQAIAFQYASGTAAAEARAAIRAATNDEDFDDALSDEQHRDGVARLEARAAAAREGAVVGSIENICNNAKARLIARTDITSRWTAGNVSIVASDYPNWPRHEFACKLSLGSAIPGGSQLQRGALKVDIALFRHVDESQDQSAITDALLEAVAQAHLALQHSWLNGSLDEPLVLQTRSSVRRVTQDAGGGDGWGVAAFLEYRWGVLTGTDHIPKGDGGSGIDRGGSS
jgi:hypothetical protein